MNKPVVMPFLESAQRGVREIVEVLANFSLSLSIDQRPAARPHREPTNGVNSSDFEDQQHLRLVTQAR